MKEWIVTNGLGGYASLSVNHTNTRKYHGLLVASLHPPTQRWVFVSNVYDKIIIDDKEIKIHNIKPIFTYDVLPTFTYDVDNTIIEKTILMEHEKNTTVIKYNITTKKPIIMIHQPVINSRHIYDVTGQRYLDFNHEVFDKGVYVKPANVNKSLKIICKNFNFTPKFYWEEFFYEKDRERNESWIDNNINIGDFSHRISSNSEYYLVFTIEDEINDNLSTIKSNEILRKKNLLKSSNLPEKFDKLVLSADNFIVNKGNSKSIIAGYHWFGDWGRDALISLPGLTLVTKRFDDAKEILYGLSSYCEKGLIPNAFMERDSEAVYNTVDASLWFIDRVFQYLKYTNDQQFLKQMWGTLESIIYSYKRGTDFDIHMDNDFLISHGPGLTWMDIKIDDFYPTPRNSKAVEIQALWYNALKIMGILAEKIGKENYYDDLSEKVKNSFNSQYDQQYDVIDTQDLSFRPNQIFLISLDFTMIKQALQEKIIEDVHKKLYTVFGLRTLSQDHPNYKGSYIGNYNKDTAYHNGMIWPWLLGHYIKAYLKIKKQGDMWREFSHRKFIQPLLDIFGNNWDGSIHEIYDGDPAHAPRGCISQAWSVAEILRAWIEDIENIRPPYEDKYLKKTNKIFL